jgi:hypothetical protein
MAASNTILFKGSNTELHIKSIVAPLFVSDWGWRSS